MPSSVKRMVLRQTQKAVKAEKRNGLETAIDITKPLEYEMARLMGSRGVVEREI